MVKNRRLVGVVTHYYQKIGVLVIELSDKLKVGQEILFVRGGEELFTQKIESMQLEHKNVTSGDKGDEVGIKTKKAVKGQAQVFTVKRA